MSRHEIHIGRVLGLFIFGYVGLHLVIDFNIYDRYALPLLIPGTLGVALGLQVAFDFARRFSLSGMFWLLIPLILAANALFGVSRTAPVGGDGTFGRWGVYAGIDALAEYINAKPVATVIYDPWLGWELGYYMGEWNDKRHVHYPTPDSLAADAAALDEEAPRYLVAPRDQPLTEWLTALSNVGFMTSLDYDADGFVAYRLVRALN